MKVFSGSVTEFDGKYLLYIYIRYGCSSDLMMMLGCRGVSYYQCWGKALPIVGLITTDHGARHYQ